jgi:glutaredoxin
MPEKTKEVQKIVVRKPTEEELEKMAASGEFRTLPTLVVESLPDEMIDFLARVVLSLQREGKL